MGAMATPPLWIPEDEVLLKNAVEAGASLESLAKGAVQFSRHFTVQELRDHWSSLLYDPIVSEESSANMIEVERSTSLSHPRINRLESVKEMTGTSMKRKGKSIRKRYYAMRKRICSEPFDMMGLNLLSGPDNSNFRDFNEADCGIVNPISNDLGIIQGQDHLPLHGENVSHNLSYPYEENILFEAEGLETEGNNNARPEFVGPTFPLPEMPIWSDDPEISVQIGEEDQTMGDAFITPPAGEVQGLGYGGAHSNSNLKTSLSCDSITNLVNPSTEDYFAELSNTLFDFTNEDDLLFMDTDGKDPIDKSYYDGLSSLLLDSPSQTDLPSNNELVGTNDDNKEELINNIYYQQKVLEASPAPTVKGVGLEYRNVVSCCTLNTQDVVIPPNEDVFLPFRFPSPTNSSGVHWSSHLQDPSYLVSSSSLNEDFPTTQKANRMKSVMGSSLQSDAGLKYSSGDRGVKFELPKSNIQHAAIRNNSSRNSSECENRISSANACANSFITGVVERGKDNLDCKFVGPALNMHENGSLDVLPSFQKNDDADAEYPNHNNNTSASAELSCEKTIASNPIEDSPPLSDQEEIWSEDDFDVPYFSDVEAMILDMDLSPDEFDLYTNPEVQQFQHEETKRTIIRLEQVADACTQRALASKGAFAILYGLWSKHFINKPDVILGRATEDTKVDIDLGREKNGGKISRRQAIMKMDSHGIFHLKNLGKHLIHVNGKAVAPGQSLALPSGCLIQVKDLAYVFETNRKHIKQYVDSITEGGLLPDQQTS